jgi:hypothetical protein
MTWLRAVVGLGIALFLTACDIHYATFVTSTDIGISANATTENLQLGYVRTELFVGPGYPDQGETPQVVGFLGSNLSAFSPKIKQLYATGDAADLVTQIPDPTTDPEKPGPYAGDRRPLIFGTGTNLGLNVGFTGNAPSSFKFGFNREELSIIPLRPNVPTADAPDKYAAVLASIDMDQETSTLPQTTLQLTQFFATGAAARNLAKRADIRALFAQQAAGQVEQATVTAWTASIASSNAKIKAYLEKGGGYSTANRDALLKASNLPDFMLTDLKNAATEDDFFTALNKHVTLIPTLAAAASK